MIRVSQWGGGGGGSIVKQTPASEEIHPKEQDCERHSQGSE